MLYILYLFNWVDYIDYIGGYNNMRQWGSVRPRDRENDTTVFFNIIYLLVSPVWLLGYSTCARGTPSCQRRCGSFFHLSSFRDVISRMCIYWSSNDKQLDRKGVFLSDPQFALEDRLIIGSSDLSFLALHPPVCADVLSLLTPLIIEYCGHRRAFSNSSVHTN